ncbi:hypothetical protein HTV45_16000 [Streptomyces sp. CHD11]|uniref:hypothetical protein n=1 Tax=Streptomyces sp. CHD11 TaxID=2741325 RepID=UPI001BFC24BE|nr:hypothetical protein [Streptomyces sp. CHD11]MBT3152364.1 hypothetical protein [Streptomyces sp. CHD11]
MTVEPLDEPREGAAYFGDREALRNIALTMGGAPARLPRADADEESPALSG